MVAQKSKSQSFRNDISLNNVLQKRHQNLIFFIQIWHLIFCTMIKNTEILSQKVVSAIERKCYIFHFVMSFYNEKYNNKMLIFSSSSGRNLDVHEKVKNLDIFSTQLFVFFGGQRKKTRVKIYHLLF